MPPGQRSQYGGNVYWVDQPKTYPTMPKLPNTSTAVKPASIASIIANAPGTTSRAYANARGSQAGLNIPGSTYATQSQGVYPAVNPIQAAASTRLGGGGGGGSGGGAAAAPVDPLAGWTQETADLSKNPIPGLYDDLLAYVKTNTEARPAEYQALADKFTAQQKVSDQQMYDAYLGSRKGTDDSAVAFGVDPAVISQARDLAMRQSQEKSDQALASNQAFLQKMGLLAEQRGQAYGYQFAGDKASKSAEWADLESNRVLALNVAKLQALVDAQNAKKSGGGGGGRRGGGSSSGSTGVTETDTLANGGVDLAVYNELARTDPKAAAAYMNMFNTSSGTPGQKAAQTRLNDLSAAAAYNPSLKSTKSSPFSANSWIQAAKNSIANVPITAARGNAAASKKLIPTYTKVLSAFDTFAGNKGNPKTQIVEKRSGKAKP